MQIKGAVCTCVCVCVCLSSGKCRGGIERGRVKRLSALCMIEPLAQRDFASAILGNGLGRPPRDTESTYIYIRCQYIYIEIECREREG